MISTFKKGILGAFVFMWITGFHHQASAYNLELLKNDKELKTHAYGSIEKLLAKKRMAAYADVAYSSFGNAINELEARNQLCEIGLYRHFKNKLVTDSIPSNSENVQDLLINWRSENRIDDILFEIIDQTSEISEKMDGFHAKTPSISESRKAAQWLLEKEITAMDLGAIYDELKGFSITSPGCSLSSWNRANTNLLESMKDQDDLRKLNVSALNEKVLNTEEFELVEFYRTQKIHRWKVGLEQYLELLSSIKNKSKPKTENPVDQDPNPLSSKKKKSKRILKKTMTYRQSIYSRFNSTQILMIENVMKKTFDRMDATRTEVVFNFKNGSETVPVSPMGQYYLARRLLRKEMDDLNRSTFFQSTPVTHEDLIAVSLETGLINARLVDSALKIDDLWNQEVPKWRKFANFGFQITGTATIFLPPPYNIVSSIALVFVDGIIQRGTKKASQSEPDYDFF